MEMQPRKWGVLWPCHSHGCGDILLFSQMALEFYWKSVTSLITSDKQRMLSLLSALLYPSWQWKKAKQSLDQPCFGWDIMDWNFGVEVQSFGFSRLSAVRIKYFWYQKMFRYLSSQWNFTACLNNVWQRDLFSAIKMQFTCCMAFDNSC